MYAGVVTEKSTADNSAPQLVRFLAKANRAEYRYIAKHQLWDDPENLISTTKTFIGNNRTPPTDPDKFVLLPEASIETKAGWRVLYPSEASSGRFHTALVRYYEKVPGTNVRCFHQATFGLVALHIIQKTPLAPYFIYASFEQADNILNANGVATEDAGLKSDFWSATALSIRSAGSMPDNTDGDIERYERSNADNAYSSSSRYGAG